MAVGKRLWWCSEGRVWCGFNRINAHLCSCEPNHNSGFSSEQECEGRCAVDTPLSAPGNRLAVICMTYILQFNDLPSVAGREGRITLQRHWNAWRPLPFLCPSLTHDRPLKHLLYIMSWHQRERPFVVLLMLSHGSVGIELHFSIVVEFPESDAELLTCPPSFIIVTKQNCNYMVLLRKTFGFVIFQKCKAAT